MTLPAFLLPESLQAGTAERDRLAAPAISAAVESHRRLRMRKVILYMTATMDGFIAGPNNELDWMGRHT
jgi:hypothetical protein